jgi:hypothetical protein
MNEGGNRLLSEGSAYLRQHARNPVAWYPWGEEALALARREDRPIFLSIGYAACHWCHVMEREVFEDREVADLLGRHFVAIKVDREERPDLDRTYMDAVVALTGQGGWPLSVFLTPDGKPFFGGTYFPRGAFLELCGRIAQAFDAQRSLLDEQASVLSAHVMQPLAMPPSPQVALEDILESALERLLAGLDPVWGGQVGRTKFPSPPRWSFLLDRLRTGAGPREPEIERALRLVLDGMASGGLQDHLAGGFHRYATEPSWLVPHFEKMLYDNALLASLYLDAAEVLREPGYARVAEDTLDFLLRDMREPGGALAASLDADSEGREGAFYLWRPAEIEAVAGPRDGPALARILGVEEGGNFEGASILSRRADLDQLARELERPREELAALYPRYRESLRQARAVRPAPARDDKVVTAWNGLALSALARGGAGLGAPAYLEAAEAVAERLWRTQRLPDGGLARASNQGRAVGRAMLDDHAALARGFVDLAQAGARSVWLARALELLDEALRLHARPGGGFYLNPTSPDTPLGQSVELEDGVTPSGTASLLGALWEAGRLAGRPEFVARVEDELRTHQALLARAGAEMAAWLKVAARVQASRPTA